MKTLKVARVGSFEELDDKFPSHKIECVNWEDYPYRPDVSFQAGHDCEYLYIRYEVNESHIKGSCLDDGEQVCRDSCVEIFIQEPDSDYYYNFEFNCLGTLRASRRRSREDSKALSHHQLESVGRGASFAPEAVDIVDNSDPWGLVVAIPFELIGCRGVPKRLRVNLYKCGDETNMPHYLSWSQINTPEPDFHRPEFFGEFLF